MVLEASSLWPLDVSLRTCPHNFEEHKLSKCLVQVSKADYLSESSSRVVGRRRRELVAKSRQSAFTVSFVPRLEGLSVLCSGL
jgi:hypothetical protein